MPKVSVIVPVYGVEKYIERCARSLFEQTLDDIEYIFVDDCTPDKSIEILESIIEEYRLRFTEEKKNVRIERMPTNSGQAVVRRHGIQLATGDYIIHCDSDDWVDVDMYRLMYEKAIEEKSNIVVCDYVVHNGKDKVFYSTGCFNKDGRSFLNDLMYQRIGCSLCNKLIESGLYKNIEYYPTGAMAEDMVLMLQMCYFCSSVSYINRGFYYYFQNPISICHQNSPEGIIRNHKLYKQNFELICAFFESRADAVYFRKQLNWLKCSVKLMLSVNDSKVRRVRTKVYPWIELRVLLDCDVSHEKKIYVIKEMIRRVLPC